MSNRSFTIEKVLKDNNKTRYSGGRYISDSPSNAVKKAFSQIYRRMREKPKSLKIYLRETTQNSKKKTYIYRVSKIKQDLNVKMGDEMVSFEYKLKTKSLKK
jgi:hypothetical protein